MKYLLTQDICGANAEDERTLLSPQIHRCVYFTDTLSSNQKGSVRDTQCSAASVNMLEHYSGVARVKRDRMSTKVWSDPSWGQTLLSDTIWTDGSQPLGNTCKTLPAISRLSALIRLLLPEVIFTGHYTKGTRCWEFCWQGNVQSARITSQHKSNPF